VKPFPIEELVDRCGSRFTVVVAAAKRAKQIKEGAPPLVNLPTRNPLTIALHEIAAGLVEITEEIVVVEEPAVVAEETIHELATPEVVAELLGQSVIDDIVDGPDESYDPDLEEAAAEDLDEDLEDEEEDDDEELEDLETEEDDDWEEDAE
jgi:DNA-directed RNA polymerase subunit omega